MSMKCDRSPADHDRHNFIIHEDSSEGLRSANGTQKVRLAAPVILAGFDSSQSGDINATDGAGQDGFIPLMTSKMSNVGSSARRSSPEQVSFSNFLGSM